MRACVCDSLVLFGPHLQPLTPLSKKCVFICLDHLNLCFFKPFVSFCFFFVSYSHHKLNSLFFFSPQDQRNSQIGCEIKLVLWFCNWIFFCSKENVKREFGKTQKKEKHSTQKLSHTPKAQRQVFFFFSVGGKGHKKGGKERVKIHLTLEWIWVFSSGDELNARHFTQVTAS